MAEAALQAIPRPARLLSVRGSSIITLATARGNPERGPCAPVRNRAIDIAIEGTPGSK
jgi:hypothetical protein